MLPGAWVPPMCLSFLCPHGVALGCARPVLVLSPWGAGCGDISCVPVPQRSLGRLREANIELGVLVQPPFPTPCLGTACLCCARGHWG